MRAPRRAGRVGDRTPRARDGVETVRVTDEDEYFPPPRELRELIPALDAAAALLLGGDVTTVRAAGGPFADDRTLDASKSSPSSATDRAAQRYAMLPVHIATIRLFLHVLGATVWVGGQIALAAVVPVVRHVAGVDALRATARRFQQVAWPAFALLLVTGVWNLFAVKVGDASDKYLTTLFVKLLLVGVSGAAAATHTVIARRRPALGGALAGVALLAALGATFLGVLLGTSG